MWEVVPSDATKNFSRLSYRSLPLSSSTNLWLGDSRGFAAVTYATFSTLAVGSVACLRNLECFLLGSTVCTLFTGCG